MDDEATQPNRRIDYSAFIFLRRSRFYIRHCKEFVLMTPTELAQLEELVRLGEKATALEWEVVRKKGELHDWVAQKGSGPRYAFIFDVSGASGNAKFIAAAANARPLLRSLLVSAKKMGE